MLTARASTTPTGTRALARTKKMKLANIVAELSLRYCFHNSETSTIKDICTQIKSYKINKMNKINK